MKEKKLCLTFVIVPTLRFLQFVTRILIVVNKKSVWNNKQELLMWKVCEKCVYAIILFIRLCIPRNSISIPDIARKFFYQKCKKRTEETTAIIRKGHLKNQLWFNISHKNWILDPFGVVVYWFLWPIFSLSCLLLTRNSYRCGGITSTKTAGGPK